MNEQDRADDQGVFRALLGDGRPLLVFTGLCLVLSGLFALFLSATGRFLPHDVQFLGMTAEELCDVAGSRVVHFMFHDRVAFGGSLVAVGALYMWLAAFPLRRGEPWAWWLLVVSGLVGFGSFLTYLGYGYLDSWHGVATLLLLPCFVAGLAKSHSLLTPPFSIRSLLTPGITVPWKSRLGVGRICLLATAIGMVMAGLTITVVGMTRVFVPTDLVFIGLSRSQLGDINSNLIPLIAHDRTGFGGGICACGITVLFCVWCARPSRSLWQVLCIAGLAGFGAAIGIHPIVGYTDLMHLAPAFAGALMFATGLALAAGPMLSPRKIPSPAPSGG